MRAQLASASAWRQAAMVRQSALGRSGQLVARPAFLHQALAFAALALLVFLNVAMSYLKFAGVPVRSLVAMAILLALAVTCTEATERAVRKYLPLIGLAAALAAIGTFASLANGDHLDAVVQTLAEVHLQVVVTAVVAAILVEIGGVGAAVLAIVAVIALSAAFAVLQFAGVHAAWAARAAVAPLSAAAERPIGLSYSTTQLGNQLCLAFAAFLAVRHFRRRSTQAGAAADPAVIVALLALFVVCIASGNRSPILGGAIFFAVYSFHARRSWIPFAVLFGGLLLYFAWPAILSAVSAAQPRVVRFDDNSAASRLALAYYGVRLFLDNPLGYGFAFEPFRYWTEYWHDLYMIPTATAVQSSVLHNYLLSMLNIYGVGLLLVLPFVVKLLVRARAALIFFIPYMVQIAFHNSAPFFGDTIIWLVVPAVVAAYPQSDGPAPRLYTRRMRAPVTKAITAGQPNRATVFEEDAAPRTETLMEPRTRVAR
jgi:hypothetical protein